MLVVKIVFMGFFGDVGRSGKGGGARGLSGTDGLVDGWTGTGGGLSMDLGFSEGAGGSFNVG